MKKYSLFILFCMLLGTAAQASVPGIVQGKIIDAENGEPVVGAVIQALNSSNKPLSFAASNTDGNFRLNLKAGIDSISFRCLGYEPMTLHVTADFATVTMTPAATRLKDVIVKAPDIYAKGDTLVFNVDKFANAKDNAIIDVIKRLPGIKVEEDGTIKYQGKPISKFYLDGNDFLDGNYGLATENISHKDVKSVEVMENHQPVKALEGIEFPEEAGINLKLKEDARSRWVGVAEATTGLSPFLYDGSLFTMRIAAKAQSMFTLKADNTGWNPATHITEHSYDNLFSSDYQSSPWIEYLTADRIMAPLSEKRTRDNLSWLANAITAWRTGDTSMRLKLNYIGDRLDYSSGVRTDYFSQSIPDFVQRNDLRTRFQEISTLFNAEVNKRGYFLKDKLTILADFDRSASAISGTYNLAQHVNRRNIAATNDLKLVKRNDRKMFTVSSRNSFNRTPSRLSVAHGSDALQSIIATDCRSTTESNIARLTRFWKFHLTAGADFEYRRLDMSLSGMEQYDNSELYNIFTSRLSLTPKADYERGVWRASLSIPMKWEHYSLRGSYNFISVSPRVYLRRQLSAKSHLTASLSYALTPEAPYMFVTTPVLSDFHNIFIATPSGEYPQTTSASLSYTYRNPLNAFFMNLSASYSHSRSPLTSNQEFLGDFIISTFQPYKSSSDVWSAKGGVSKGIGHGKMVTGMDVTMTHISSESMRDSRMVHYRQLSAQIRPYLKGSVTSWFSMNYDINYSYSQLNMESNGRTSHHSLTQSIAATFLPTDLLNFTAGVEHYFTRFPEGNNANLILLDASASWSITSRLRLSLTANNLLNKRQYQYVTYGTLSRSENNFTLRSRTILATLQMRF